MYIYIYIYLYTCEWVLDEMQCLYTQCKDSNLNSCQGPATYQHSADTFGSRFNCCRSKGENIAISRSRSARTVETVKHWLLRTVSS